MKKKTRRKWTVLEGGTSSPTVRDEIPRALFVERVA